MQGPSSWGGTRIYVEVVSTIPSAKLRKINFDMQQDFCLKHSTFSITSRGQDLVRLHITVASNEQQNFEYEAPGPAFGTLLSERIRRHATEQQMEDLT
ncbi:uncharacterized protein Bfra_007688 [Botrytis fragariae]|uniref:Uncharacterized protein n=1 Tax=Botrytis fragariae TaxID=1964551 RepID=A0A8H6APM1_9HELO|nr:uncharacterized protein Bfra_007688 [Botrytis fragariae]KAF5871174.1 hypothetical protein Bfra_007688 [Botrytis fragariae]